MSRCPTCGHPLSTDGVALVRKMKAARETGACVYRGRDGNYYIEYNGGQVDRASIDSALAAGLIQAKFPDLPDGYWKLTHKGYSL